jgi:hypothetical protein
VFSCEVMDSRVTNILHTKYHGVCFEKARLYRCEQEGGPKKRI